MPGLEVGQQQPDEPGDAFAAAQVHRPLPPAVAIGHPKVGAEPPSAVRSPRGHYAALGGEKCRMRNQIRPDPLEPGGGFLVNKFAFFHVWALSWGDSEASCPLPAFGQQTNRFPPIHSLGFCYLVAAVEVAAHRRGAYFRLPHKKKHSQGPGHFCSNSAIQRPRGQNSVVGGRGAVTRPAARCVLPAARCLLPAACCAPCTVFCPLTTHHSPLFPILHEPAAQFPGQELATLRTGDGSGNADRPFTLHRRSLAAAQQRPTHNWRLLSRGTRAPSKDLAGDKRTTRQVPAGSCAVTSDGVGRVEDHACASRRNRFPAQPPNRSHRATDQITAD